MMFIIVLREPILLIIPNWNSFTRHDLCTLWQCNKVYFKYPDLRWLNEYFKDAMPPRWSRDSMPDIGSLHTFNVLGFFSTFIET
jgi:hypothetical protein